MRPDLRIQARLHLDPALGWFPSSRFQKIRLSSNTPRGLKTEANWPSGTLPTILTRLHEDQIRSFSLHLRSFAGAAFSRLAATRISGLRPGRRCRNGPVLSLQEVLKKHRRFLSELILFSHSGDQLSRQVAWEQTHSWPGTNTPHRPR